MGTKNDTLLTDLAKSNVNRKCPRSIFNLGDYSKASDVNLTI